MPPRFNWLNDVETILRADTGDLRALARLAGEDPRTLYIGTRLDGADLRGQDLRGMILDLLDPNLVLMDDQTRFDGQTQPVSELSDSEEHSERSGLALVDGEFLDRPIPRRIRTGLGNLQLYGPDNSEAFWIDAKRSNLPSFVIGKPETSERLYEGHQGNTLAIHLTPHREGRAFSQSHRYTLPVVVVPTGGFGPVPSTSSLSGPLADALALFINDWGLARRITKRSPMWAFVRAKAANTPEEAWSRILATVTRNGLLGLPGVRLANANLLDDGFDHAAFPNLELLPAHWDLSAPSDEAAVLLDLAASPILSPGDAYASAVADILERGGWSVHRQQTPFGTTSDVLGFSGSWLSFDARTDSSPPARRLDNRGYHRTDPAVLHNISRVVFSEWATERAICWNLANRHELWVNARDISVFTANSATVWSLIAQQVRRISRAYDARGRTEYFLLLIGAARNISLPARRRSKYLDFLFDSLPGQDFIITSGVAKRWGSETTVRLKVFELVSGYRGGVIAELELTIGPEGPAVDELG